MPFVEREPPGGGRGKKEPPAVRIYLSHAEQIARLVETVYMPAYSPEKAAAEGETAKRSQVYEDLQIIVNLLRSRP